MVLNGRPRRIVSPNSTKPEAITSRPIPARLHTAVECPPVLQI